MSKGKLNSAIECLKLHYYQINIYVHEQVFYGEHRPEDFRPPYVLRKFPIQSLQDNGSSRQYQDAIAASAKSAHELLDAFLAMDLQTLRTIPVIAYTRMFYSLIVLTKVFVSSVSSESWQSILIDPDSLRFDAYLEKLLSVLREAQGPENHRVARVFRLMVQNLSDLCLQGLRNFHEQLDGSEEAIHPMAYSDNVDCEDVALSDDFQASSRTSLGVSNATTSVSPSFVFDQRLVSETSSTFQARLTANSNEFNLAASVPHFSSDPFHNNFTGQLFSDISLNPSFQGFDQQLTHNPGNMMQDTGFNAQLDETM